MPSAKYYSGPLLPDFITQTELDFIDPQESPWQAMRNGGVFTEGGRTLPRRWGQGAQQLNPLALPAVRSHPHGIHLWKSWKTSEKNKTKKTPSQPKQPAQIHSDHIVTKFFDLFEQTKPLMLINTE